MRRTMIENKPKIVAIIPAHLASVRFPRKVLFPFLGYPMIEHVRRRALLSSKIDDVCGNPTEKFQRLLKETVVSVL